MSGDSEGRLALLEVLDRDGQVRQSISVRGWPLRIGRAFDNDVVLSDPHVAAEHLTLALGERGLALIVGETKNGVQLGSRKLTAHTSHLLASSREAPEFSAGRTRLRLRLPDQALAPELPLAVVAPLRQRLVPIAVAALVLMAGMLFNTYLDTDADGLGRAVGNTLLSSVAGALIWCGAWALLTKTFTHQARFGWHLRVFLFSSIAWLVVGALPGVLAFALSWPWLTDFAFVGSFVVGAAALYFHLLAVEPARHRGLRWAAVACAVVGVALTLWFNVQRTDQFGEELYMNHLFPPALRLARPVANDTFIDDLARLKPLLDKKAKETSGTDDAGGKAEVEE
ncbi:MAG: FHA domain-containing protein [Burkholderiales bacterium]|nr:FHA domain-containing protein [Burkholderiales bacterium]